MRLALGLCLLTLLLGPTAAGEPPSSEEDAVPVFVDGAGRVWLTSESPVGGADLVAGLREIAERRREAGHPEGRAPCALTLVIHADARAPWSSVCELMREGHRRENRTNRYLWAVRKPGECEVATVPVFVLPVWGRTPPPGPTGGLLLVVDLAREPSAEATVVRYLGERIGTLEDGCKALEKRVRALDGRGSMTAVLTCSKEGVPFIEVVRVLTLLRAAGLGGVALHDLGVGPFPVGTGREVPEAPRVEIREQLELFLRTRFRTRVAKLPEGGAVLDEMEGLSRGFSEGIAAEGRWVELAGVLEMALWGAPEDTARFWEWILDAGLSTPPFRVRKIPGSGPAMMALVRAYFGVGGRETLRRARVLLNILDALTGEGKYGRAWWRLKLYWFQTCERLFTEHGDATARTWILKRFQDYESLGLLRDCPYEREIREIFERMK